MKNKKSKLKLIKILGKVLLPLLAILFPFSAIAFMVSPNFFSWIVRIFFDHQFEEFIYTDDVKSFSNISYGEARGEKFDLHLPDKKGGTYPLIIFAHGGAYVAGDKNNLIFFARLLAHYGYAVATINYTLAPKAHYPTQLLQIGKAYTFLTTKDYDGKELVDTSRLFLAGDSAGAQMMAQLVVLQTNPAYRANFMKLHPQSLLPEAFPAKALRGVLLYCGPYVFDEIKNSPKRILRLFFNQMCWAYFGKRKYTDLPAFEEIEIIPHLTAEFPPAFITDGNTLTFPTHGRALSEALEQLGVKTTTLIFDDADKKIYHEFELNIAIPEARQALVAALAFLKKNSTH